MIHIAHTPDLTITRLISDIRSSRIPIGIVSASRNAKFILSQVGLLDAFDVISDGWFVGAAKPSPEQILSVTETLSIPTKHIAVFDDAIVASKRHITLEQK